MTEAASTVGEHLRIWRQRRRLTQLDLALEAGVSSKHLSFLETGRARPSREMLLHLAEALEVPMRERNVLLTAAGFAPVFPERPLLDGALGPVRRAIDLALEAQKPFPAFAFDRHWNVVASNSALPQLYEGVDESLIHPVLNVARLCLHPRGMAPRTSNLAEWRAHLLHRLRRQIDLTADPVLIDLLAEVSAYPAPSGPGPAGPPSETVAIPLRMVTSVGLLSFLTATAVFGGPVDVTLSELTLEVFYPADAETDRIVRALPAAELARIPVTA
jgi:transcriptional regulator with XRE-family HTH domain